jgi:chromosome segregation protein
MNHGIDPTESTDIRRALDRLQGTLEEFSDRFREVRRERRQMHEYIIELEREVERAERAASQQTEAGAAERERTSELLERIEGAERRHGELMSRIAELEQAVRERESLVAEQEDLIQQYQVRFDDAREFGARNESARRELDLEVIRLREELEQSRSTEQEATRRARELEASARDGGPAAQEEVAALTAQLAQLRQSIERLESERAELVSNQTRFSDEFEAVRRSEQAALERSAQLESTLAEMTERERIRTATATELESRNRALETELEALSARLRDVEAARADGEHGDGLDGAASGGNLPDEERREMIGQIETAIGIIDRYLSEA